MSQEERNMVTLEDECFELQPTVKFYRYKNGMLSVNIELKAEPVDEESSYPFEMTIGSIPTDVTDVKELANHSYSYDVDASLAGFIWDSDDDDTANEEDTIEFLEATDDKVVIKWCFSCSDNYSDELFEYGTSYEIVFEADYVIEDSDEEYPIVYTADFEPTEDDMDYFNADGVLYNTSAKIEFLRHKDSKLLSMNLYLYGSAENDHIDTEANGFTMSFTAVPLGVTDITDLKGKVFENSEMDGLLYCVEHESNEDETMEILDITDEKFLIRWSGLCSIGWGRLGYNFPFEALFEAKYTIKDSESLYPVKDEDGHYYYPYHG